MISSLWETEGVETPRLEITKSANGVPMEGKCSTCKYVTFQTTPDERTAQQHETLLNVMFDNHFKRVHQKEDASQNSGRRY